MEGLEYYDEEYMQELENEAFNYDVDERFTDSFELEKELSYEDIFAIRKTHTTLEVKDFKKYSVDTIFYNVKYLGWSRFFGRFIKVHFIINNEYYVYCVYNRLFFADTYNDYDFNNGVMLFYQGIKKNYKGEEYAFLTFALKLPSK